VLADMHCHYPMHLVAEDPKRAGEWSAAVAAEAARDHTRHRRPELVEWLRAKAIEELDGLINFEPGQWRVDLPKLREGDVRAVFSVLYEPFAEFDLDEPYGAPPETGYFGDLIGRLEGVESDLQKVDPGGERSAVVRSAAELDAALAADKVAFMHCVEGGFHLGATPAEIDANVAELKARGVVYVTLAHLFWRDVATDAPAIPMISDDVYRAVFEQPKAVGLTELGEAAVRAMYRERMLIDLSHMSERSLADTFALLDRLDAESGDPPTDHPVIASHTGYRFGDQEYMLGPDAIRRIADRGGVIGLILARHQLNDADVNPDPDAPAGTAPTVRRHIDAIRECLGAATNDHVAIGSDLDGFIKPTMAGIENAADLKRLEQPLRDAYEDADSILHGNALRVARWALG
jgi:microsomal dipeptidase-like Zn-dependent dipeptidase